ncbi:c-type cytochrome [Parasphingopyxis marina]|uniref:Cytochrome c n=1 Tax=Parasphingopyxis marina TaxID=2761622 RepID=A0A842HVV9_9SPHN|nr:cytochrome c [Parasphingopyxis marina]MBC2777102.1 cytochrome c [Parasphingopyxis marina]
MKPAFTVLAACMLLAACSADGEPAVGGPEGGPPPMEFRPMEAEQGADVTDPASRVAVGQDGERMFNRRCGVCHLGGGMGTNLLTGRVGPENALLAQRPGGVPSALTMAAVRNGLGAMPPLSRVEVTDAELDAIAAYLSEDHAP